MFAVLSYYYKRQKVGSLPSLTVVQTLKLLWYKLLVTTGITHPPRPECNDTHLPPVSNTIQSDRAKKFVFWSSVFNHRKGPKMG